MSKDEKREILEAAVELIYMLGDTDSELLSKIANAILQCDETELTDLIDEIDYEY